VAEPFPYFFLTKKKLSMRALKSWQSYTGPVKLGNLNIKTTAENTAAQTAPPPLKAVSQSQVKSANDDAFDAANQANINLMKRSHPDSVTAAAPLEEMHAFSVEKKRDDAAKTIEKKPSKRERATTTTTTKKSATSPKQQHRQVKKIASANEVIPIEKLEEHLVRDNDYALYSTRVADSGRHVNNIIVATPPASEVLAYARQFTENKKWFTSMTMHISNTETIDFPDVPVKSRVELLNYLHEPDPKVHWQRPCCNLDRTPLPYEKTPRCIAHVMSEEVLGQGNGFRLREIILNDAVIRINADPPGSNPMDHLGPIPEMCYLCHLWTALQDCTEQRDHIEQQEQERKDLTSLDTLYDDNVVIINRFMVMVDRLGEYDRTKMLSGDQVKLGIWGPFPLFNRQNYVYTANYPHGPDGPTGLRGFVESDNLLFRLARASSDRTECSQKTLSTQSTHTQSVSLSTLLHH
jgi:hypothetical protein